MVAIWVLLATVALNPTARMTAARASVAPRIDGHLDDSVWQEAPPSHEFVQRIPVEGNAPSEPTTVRVLYDAHAIYIGIDCEQTKTARIDRLTRRDRAGASDKLNRRVSASDSDQIVVTIGSRLDNSSAFRFGVNSAGTLSDGLYYDDVAFDASWDENWEAVTSSTARGWSVEMRIPLRVLRFEALARQEWGFNVQRSIAQRQEVDEWADIPLNTGGYVSRLGRLEGLVDLEPPRSDFELRPFVVGRLGRQDTTFGPLLGATGPANFAHGWTSDASHFAGVGASVGADARWHITRDLTLDATLNPDFAQVEADRLVLNLTTIETFYPEKRPFFLEGADIFATPLQVLYTRRMGHVPASYDLPLGETALTGTGPSAIPAAMKVVGRLTERTSVGLLSVVTAENAIPSRASQGSELRRLVDPTTLFNVLRVRQALGYRGAYVGLIGSATKRMESTQLYPTAADGTFLCPGAVKPEANSRCFRDAYVSGVDGRWRSASGNYAVSGQSLVSFLSHGRTIALPDGTSLAPNALGSGTDFKVAKDGGQHWIWEARSTLFSRKLELNDAGYLGRPNLASGSLDLAYRTRQPWGPTLETASKLELRHARNLSGLVLQDIYQLNTTILLRNAWTLFTEVQYHANRFDDREVGDGTALERAGLVGWEGSVRSDPRGVLSGQVFGVAQRLTNGWRFGFDANMLVRPTSRTDLELLPSFDYTKGESRFMEVHGEDQLLFGRLEAGQVGGTLRLTQTFAPRLTLQAYAQLFLAAGRYSDPTTYMRPTDSRPVVRLEDLSSTTQGPKDQHDFQRAALNASIVLRWEYQLGSVLYLVYTRSQVPQLDLLPGERPRLDLSLLPRAPAADVLLIKATYWFG
jgi:hypothetical protein